LAKFASEFGFSWCDNGNESEIKFINQILQCSRLCLAFARSQMIARLKFIYKLNTTVYITIARIKTC